MKIFLVLVSCVVAVLAAPSEVKSPAITLREYWASNKGLDDRIINGSPAAVGQFPFQCRNFFVVGGSTFICGCSIITTTAALTAAHCMIGASSFEIAAGSLLLNNPDPNRQTRTTTTGSSHPNYNSNNLNNDVGVITWTQPLVLSSLVGMIRLPNPGETVGVGVIVRVSGWGRTTDANQQVSQNLNFVDLTTISNAQCASVYGTNVVVASTVCAVGTGPSGNVGSTCNGDSGGPLTVISGGILTQVGVVSFVHVAGCGSGNPSGYVRTEAMRGWIAGQVTLP